jgi:hypothetical protein
MNCERLKRFRQAAYQLLGPAQDATMDLMDAVLVTRSVYSLNDILPHLDRPSLPSSFSLSFWFAFSAFHL